MLLDHKMIAGCGNIYACEALFRAGVLPERKVKMYLIKNDKCYFIMFKKY